MCADDSTLADVSATLRDDEQEHIRNYEIDLYHRTPRDDRAARREASTRMSAFAAQVRTDFLTNAIVELQREYESDVFAHFNPPVGSAFLCPHCNRQTLVLKQASIIACCKTGCDHTYDWSDSALSGCPKCNHRPHRFRVEVEAEFSDENRTTCWCRCSSSVDCISHLDGYCPKCGELPQSYDADGFTYCGIHHERLVGYKCPAEFLFMETASRWVAHRFPNAKLWGDAEPSSDGLATSYCISCEIDHQCWLADQPVEG